ncbi:MAG: hypothetical protein JST00_39150 [Deltaproteobacteria bacterium]|nr:hypothetical protein [Deltaproteobacteria bacterium]
MRGAWILGLGGILVTAAAGCGGDDAGEATNGAITDEASPPGQTTQGAPIDVPGDGAGTEGRASIPALARPGSSIGTTPGADPAPDPDPGAGTPPATPPPPTAGSAGPKPAGGCAITKDANGFFTRNSGKGSYVGYVPASYDPNAPMRLVIGLHGCGDNAQNFATWAVNPASTRATQTHLGISLGSETGSGGCWSSADDPKVLAAVDDFAKCFWVHQAKVTIAGYSSGGNVAYRVGLKNAARFAGILIENSTASGAGNPVPTLLAGAARKIPVAHRAHTGDTVYPIATVRNDWASLKAAGFPVTTSEVAGGHDGTSADWADWLLPRSAGWVAP